MSKNLKAILIDTFAREIKEVEYSGDFTEIYKLLSHETMEVTTFTIVHLDEGDAIYVDDNGLLHNPLPDAWFKWDTYYQPLVGKALILGADDEGESRSAKISTDEVRRRVKFMTLAEVEEVAHG